MPKNDPARTEPTRGCAACRARLPLAELIRFAHDGERVVVDLDRRLGGRGVNIGPARSCLEQAIKRGAFQRGFKRPLPPEQARMLFDVLGRAFITRLASYVESSRRSGAVVDVERAGEVEPPELRAVFEASEGALLGVPVPRVRVTSARAAARVAWLARGVSEFTFDIAGGMRRRPEAPVPCARARGGRTPSEK